MCRPKITRGARHLHSYPYTFHLCLFVSFIVLAILNNQIGGSLPTELGNLGEMKYFMADTNRITGMYHKWCQPSTND